MKNILLALLISLGFITNSNAQSNGSLLKVQGEARIFLVPEEMNIRIPVEAKASGYEECSNQLINSYNNLKNALIKNGIEKSYIESSRLNISENYIYTDRERKLDGYVGQITVSIDVPHTDKQLTSIMNTLKSEQFKFGYSVSFSLSEKQKKDILEAAIKEAVSDAEFKAGILATSLGVKLVTIQEVNFGLSGGSGDLLMRNQEMAYMKSDSNDSELQLNPEKIEISKSVSIVWLIAR